MSDMARMFFLAKAACSAPAPSEVVILPETEFPGSPAKTNIPIETPLSAPPTDGATAKVTYNGTEYPCTIVYLNNDGTNGYVLGNFDAIGMTYSGSNPNAPFVILLIPDGMEGEVYGFIIPLEDVDSINLSIVQTEGASGDAAESPVVVVPFTTDSSNNINISKSFDAIMALANSGKMVYLTGTLAYTLWFMPLIGARDNGEGAEMFFAAVSSDATVSVKYTRDGATLIM